MSTSELIPVMTFCNLLTDCEAHYADKRRFLDEAMEMAVSDVVAKAAKYRSSGKVVLELGFKADGENTLHVVPVLKIIEPKPGTLPVTAYTDSQGRLCADDPNQQRLPLNRVSKRRVAAND